MDLNSEQKAMLAGEMGVAKQMGMRLILDMAAAAGANRLLKIETAHLSGVSPLTGGLGLRLFLARLVQDPQAKVVVPTTLNSAGCDVAQFAAMRIAVPNFLEESVEIVSRYEQLGVQLTQSCVPYEWEGVISSGRGAWAESNAICFGNSYTGLLTNRESGLSALAAALTGYTADYGLLQESARRPNLEVIVNCELDDPTDFSILGDWIGKQFRPGIPQPYGPIPLIRGLATGLSHEQRKALTAAAANYGCPLLYLDGQGSVPEPDFQDRLHFTAGDLQQRYEQLAPQTTVSLIVIGCPQASVGELRMVAQLLKGKQVVGPPLWVFTSQRGKAIAEQTGLADLIRQSGALLLENSCPEVVPYDPRWVKQVLTNSMKAEHYIKSGLNGIPTAVMGLADCVGLATGVWELPAGVGGGSGRDKSPQQAAQKGQGKQGGGAAGDFTATGQGLPSQGDFCLQGEAFVTDTPITLLGFVNRQTGVIEEPGHPANGQSLAGKIAIFPKGSGSTVAPYVLLELYYRGMAPLAIVNTNIDQQSAPACSLEGIPYAYGFDRDPIGYVPAGSRVELKRSGDCVTIRVI